MPHPELPRGPGRCAALGGAGRAAGAARFCGGRGGSSAGAGRSRGGRGQELRDESRGGVLSAGGGGAGSSGPGGS